MNNNDDGITFTLLIEGCICYVFWATHQLYYIGRDYYTHFIHKRDRGLLILSGHLADRQESNLQSHNPNPVVFQQSHIVCFSPHPVTWYIPFHKKIYFIASFSVNQINGTVLE